MSASTSRKPDIFDQSSDPALVLFMLLPGFSMQAYAAALSLLKIANSKSEKTLYRYGSVTTGMPTAVADIGVAVIPDYAPGSIRSCDALLVVRGSETANLDIEAVPANLADNSKYLGVICSSACILARPGEHDYADRSVSGTIVEEENPALLTLNDFIGVDWNSFDHHQTASSIELMLFLIRERHGDDLADQVMDEVEKRSPYSCGCTRPLDQISTGRPSVLLEAISLMRANIEEPLKISEIAGYSGTSVRHLERLFQTRIGCSPKSYYMRLRLRLARRLILQTRETLSDISLACGFIAHPNFSKVYRDYYGVSPRQERSAI